MKASVASLLFFKLVWLAVVFSAVWSRWWLGLIAVGAFIIYEAGFRGRRHVLMPVLAVGVVGYGVDWLYVSADLLRYPEAGALVVPPWMALLWMNFALILDGGLLALRERPVLAAVLGAVGGPLAYSAGFRLELIEMLASAPLVYGVIAATWAVGFPALLQSTHYWPASQPA